MKKIKRTPQYVKNLRRAKGWESWKLEKAKQEGAVGAGAGAGAS